MRILKAREIDIQVLLKKSGISDFSRTLKRAALKIMKSGYALMKPAAKAA